MMVFENAALIWFLTGAVMLIAELILPGFIVLFFGVAAWVVALLVWWFDIPPQAQIGIFLVTSVFLILVLRQRFHRIFRGDDAVDVVDPRLGQRAVVTESIPLGGEGKVQGMGSYWPAVSKTEIAEGTHVIIVAVDESNGLAVRVEEVK